MTEGQFVSALISMLKEQLADISEDAMLHPKSKRFEAGVIVGRYQGVCQALDSIDVLLRDNHEKERQS